MKKILSKLIESQSVETAIKAIREADHHCLAQSPSVEFSIGRYRTRLVTGLPDLSMDLVVPALSP